MSITRLKQGLLALGSLLVLSLGVMFLGDAGETATDATSANQVAQVKRVVDGDTVEVTVNGERKKVRLIGIDTPETVDPRKEVECFGKEASNFLKDLVDGEGVSLEYDDSQGEVDKYGRDLVYLNLTDGTNVNEEMLRQGYAYEYTYSKPYKYREVFQQAENEARDAHKGLWSETTCNGER
jgi:micrococcal nuclease